jgi:hypothetical protein
LCVSFTLYLEEKETPKITKKMTVERETKKESRNNGLVDGRIVEIRVICSSKRRRRNWHRKFQLRFILFYFSFHPMFWFWLGLLFHFEHVF